MELLLTKYSCPDIKLSNALVVSSSLWFSQENFVKYGQLAIVFNLFSRMYSWLLKKCFKLYEKNLPMQHLIAFNVVKIEGCFE